MNILLDTHTILWFLNGDEKLPKTTREIIYNAEYTKYVSIASLWEIALKWSKGKLELDGGIDNLLENIDDNGFLLLTITSQHIQAVTKLPFIHLDPFDRVLIAQAISEDMSIVTVDADILRYDIKHIW